MSRVPTVVAAILLAVPTSVLAQDVVKAPTADKVIGESKAVEGWTLKLTFGATGSYNDSRHVVGAVDGATVQLGGLLDGAALYRNGRSLWETTLKITETQTRTPQIPEFLKSADLVDLATTYGYRVLDWFGPFVRLAANAPVFTGYSYRTSDTAVFVTPAGGAAAVPTGIALAGTRVKLTDPFEPLVLSETAGVFANPYADKAFTLSLKAGGGAQEILTKNGYVITGDTATTLNLQQLEDSTEAGALGEAVAQGALAENIAWKAKAALFYPFWTSVTTDLSGIDLMSIDTEAKLSIHLVKWLTLDYVLMAKRLPLITKKVWQVQNGFILTASVDVI